MSCDEGDITVVELKRYAYCPRIVFITHVLHLDEVVSEAMEAGLEQHDEAVITPIVAKLRALRVLRSVELRSEMLKTSGKPDYLVITRNREYVPVEVKWASSDRGRAKWDQKLQLAAYAILVEENFKTTVKRGYIYYLKDRRVVELVIDEGLKNLTRKIIGNIHRMILEERDPGVITPLTRCVNCGYRVYCRPGIGVAESQETYIKRSSPERVLQQRNAQNTGK
ncbi:MAG: CRISPR-associated protein Cas4 [Nitrososphaerota archaeon]